MNFKYPKKYYDQNGKKSILEKVTIIEGFIEKTLPVFINENKIDQVAFIYIDTDTYSPAKSILLNLKKFFRRGTIILFDEFCGYPNWRSHEFKALNEVLEKDAYEFIGFSQTTSLIIQAAIKIL